MLAKNSTNLCGCKLFMMPCDAWLTYRHESHLQESFNCTFTFLQITYIKAFFVRCRLVLNCEFHLVVNSSTCVITLKRITQQLHDVGVCFLKSSNLCWKSSISLTTNSEYFSCCTVTCTTVSVGLVGFAAGWKCRPDSGPWAVCWTPLFTVWPRAGSGVVRIDPLRFLAGCRTRRLNQA